MRLIAIFAAVLALWMSATSVRAEGEKKVNLLDIKMKGIDGKDFDFAQFKGKVVLVVNVASQCGYTPQYEGLQALYEKYGKEGLVVVGVPANEFGKQEPGTNDEIKTFCETRYKVTFPMMAKTVAKGPAIDPLFQRLTSKETDPKSPGDVRWNFEKFLIGRDGQFVARFGSGTAPLSDALQNAIQKALKQ